MGPQRSCSIITLLHFGRESLGWAPAWCDARIHGRSFCLDCLCSLSFWDSISEYFRQARRALRSWFEPPTRIKPWAPRFLSSFSAQDLKVLLCAFWPCWLESPLATRWTLGKCPADLWTSLVSHYSPQAALPVTLDQPYAQQIELDERLWASSISTRLARQVLICWPLHSIDQGSLHLNCAREVSCANYPLAMSLEAQTRAASHRCCPTMCSFAVCSLTWSETSSMASQPSDLFQVWLLQHLQLTDYHSVPRD